MTIKNENHDKLNRNSGTNWTLNFFINNCNYPKCSRFKVHKFFNTYLAETESSWSESSDVHVKPVKIWTLAEHTRKFVWRRLSVWWNRFCVCSASDEIVSANAQTAHAIIFIPKSAQAKSTGLQAKFTGCSSEKCPIKMHFSTINKRYFEKPSRNTHI
jgi:hypothetical protein